MLKDFLKENPNKTKKDFPYVTVSTKNMTAFLPFMGNMSAAEGTTK